MRCTNEVNTTGTKNLTHSQVKQYVDGLGGGLHGLLKQSTSKALVWLSMLEELNRLEVVIGVIDERGHGRRGAFWT
jgi:hypothetical protein